MTGEFRINGLPGIKSKQEQNYGGKKYYSIVFINEYSNLGFHDLQTETNSTIEK